ncbi:hypothetical protein PENSPDRAFT_150081 [Peniophora sp. CONT]|nr:hypothetical protein PENSPDRAFT_150081 [Peniophora sp. CONT]
MGHGVQFMLALRQPCGSLSSPVVCAADSISMSSVGAPVPCKASKLASLLSITSISSLPQRNAGITYKTRASETKCETAGEPN